MWRNSRNAYRIRNKNIRGRMRIVVAPLVSRIAPLILMGPRDGKSTTNGFQVDYTAMMASSFADKCFSQVASSIVGG